ncbi:MAG TPA: LysR family transcriptional regulator [Polyangia bacterium]|nr:LysR family transcriptional regulator [Polyangia bacterium]
MKAINARDLSVDLNLISTFVRVVELGSFTAAAKALGVPTSSVSRAVRRLEESLGARLLQRTTRRLGLTQAGERYLGEVRGPLARVAEASGEIADGSREPRGVVRISLASTMNDGVLAELFTAFARQHPGIRLELVVTSRRVNLVEEGIDMALRGGKLDDSSLVARKLAVAELGLFAAPAYLERRGTPKRFSELAAHDGIVHKRADGSSPFRLVGPHGVERAEVNARAVVDDLDTVRALTVAGLGVAVLPDVAARADVERGALVRVLPEYKLSGSPMNLVSVPLRHVPTRVKLLRDFLIREIPKRLAGTPCAVTPPAPRRAQRARVGAAGSFG